MAGNLLSKEFPWKPAPNVASVLLCSDHEVLVPAPIMVSPCSRSFLTSSKKALLNLWCAISRWRQCSKPGNKRKTKKTFSHRNNWTKNKIRTQLVWSAVTIFDRAIVHMSSKKARVIKPLLVFKTWSSKMKKPNTA